MRRRFAGFVIAIIAALLVGAGAAWGAMTVLRPAEDPLQTTTFTSVEVKQGEVGSEINLNTVAEWTLVPVGENRAAGVVTSVGVGPGAEVTQGTVLYAVNLRPVVVAKGDVPAFRAIGEKTAGPDVAQLQQLLTDLGIYNGTIDGTAASGTVAAIKAWQKSLGLEQTGVVEAGDIVYVPALPTRVSLDAKVVFRGATLAGGESVVSGLPASPSFSIPVTDTQAAMMPAGTRVDITSPQGTPWQGITGDQSRNPDTQTISVAVSGVDGAPVCADTCGQVPVTGASKLASRIVTVEKVAGLVVPSAALVTDANGTTAVVAEDGTRTTVTVVASARGMSVVDGVSAGQKVRIPAKGAGG